MKAFPNILRETKKECSMLILHSIYGDSLGTRTLDPLIKSQLLYQLS